MVKAKPATDKNVGAMEGLPRLEWYVRRNSNEEWFGPLSFRDADKQARVSTREGTPMNVLYAQVGTPAGDRPGDPEQDREMTVVFLYENGKAFLGGRPAKVNKNKLF